MGIDWELVQTVQAMAELYGKTMSEMAATMLLADLERYPASQVKGALAKCRRELRTFPTLAEIIARLDDGRPGIEEAWAMIPKSESDSVVWTEEMAAAFDVVRHMIDEDHVAARMAFKEHYARALSDARNSGKPARWTASLGFDRNAREAVLATAVAKGRLSEPQARALLPDFGQRKDFTLKQLIAVAEQKSGETVA